MTELLALAGNWQAAIAGLVAAALIGFQIYLKTRRDLREDKQGDKVSDGYLGLIASMQTRLDWQEKELQKKDMAIAALTTEVERLHQLCSECRDRQLSMEKIIEMRKKPRP